MQYTVSWEPDFYLESLYIIDAIFNDEGAAKDLKEMEEKFAGQITESFLQDAFGDAIALESHVKAHMTFIRTGYGEEDLSKSAFLYKPRAQTNISPATALFFFELCPANDDETKLKVILECAIPEYFEQHELADQSLHLQGETALFAYVDALPCDAATKYDILHLYYHFDEYYAYNNEIIERVSALIREKIPGMEEKIHSRMTYIQTALETEGLWFFKNHFNISMEDEQVYHVYPLLSRPNQLSVHIRQPLSDSRISFGMSILMIQEMIKNLRSDRSRLTDFIKLLSDNTKLTIFQMLKEEACYAGQLAEKTGLTGATISHHMQAFTRLELVLIEKENTRVYYKLHMEKVRSYLDGLREMLL